ncbi:MAG: cytochrome C, partial [Candidatus Marinimicrobia bacterium]|nr:cytochrome C [Candidatus Neomarinimicrobiota bacterium]
MNYPIWELPTIGGGSLIALIAILHVYVAHLAVGGGLFLWLTDLKGFREDSSQIHDYVKKHTWFFLLLTMVFGAVTGVGIWFIIALVNPAATSMLIHNFVFGWAIEWVFFVGEIIALLVYYYKFDTLGRQNRLRIAFLYFAFAWLSLFIINGILSFMLTPGAWLENGQFWSGFFNPTFFPSLVFRTAMAVIIAGLFGLATTVFLKDSEFRTNMIRYCSKWLFYPLAGIVVFGAWYYFAIPVETRMTNFLLNPQTDPFQWVFIAATVLIFLFGVFMTLQSNLAVQRIATFTLIIIGLAWIGGFEYLREISRKPFVIHDVMFSNSILSSDIEELDASGVLSKAKWTSIHRVDESKKMEAGYELYNIQCAACHTMNGIRNDVVERSENLTYTGMLAQLTGQGKILTYMPKFTGTDQEKDALASYLTGEVLEKELQPRPEPYSIEKTYETEIPPFDEDEAEYILLAWNDLGMHCISDSDPWFVILPPANTLEAQLIRRGEVPQLVRENVELTYQVQEGFEDPAAHVEFWDYDVQNFGADLEENVGLFGKAMSGTFRFEDDRNGFIAEAIPVVPYMDNGDFNPYPIFTVEARDAESGELLATTDVVAPTSTEMGCRNCHGGDWRVNGTSGVAEETAINILKAHDKHSGTDLYEKALNGEPQLCQSCHADPALGAPGKPEHMNLSASLHGWHANYMHKEGGDACASCHPAYEQGRTRCSRGVHAQIGLDCTSCHGSLSDHAASLLKGEIDKPSASRLLANLETSHVESIEEVNAREPWLNEPDCLTCHQDFQQPTQIDGFNDWNTHFMELYRIRTGYRGVRCIGCHGSTHAVYPAENPYGENRDNIQPMQYSGEPL